MRLETIISGNLSTKSNSKLSKALHHVANLIFLNFSIFRNVFFFFWHSRLLKLFINIYLFFFDKALLDESNQKKRSFIGFLWAIVSTNQSNVGTRYTIKTL